MEEISQHSVLLALVCIQLLSMKEPPPGYMSDIQEKINVFTANLHPLILLPGIIKGFSDCLKVLSVCVCVFSVYTICCLCVGGNRDRKGGYHS